MKLLGLICLSILSGVIGGLVDHFIAPPAAAQMDNHEIHLADGFSRCDLTSRGLRVKWNDGREINLDARALELRSERHSITLAVSDLKEIDASYLVLDGRVWSAPSSRDKTALLAGLAMLGEIDFNQIENRQPQD